MRTQEDERQIKKTNKQEIAALRAELVLQAKIMASMLGIFWGTYLVNNVWLDNWIGQNLAIQAGSFSGALGVLLTPFLHVSPWHVVSSSAALLFLGWWVMLRDTRDFFVVHIMAMLSSGALLWAFDDTSMRWFGWGGVAFGMAGYLMTSGIFERRWGSIISSVIAIALLGGLVSSALVPGAVMGYTGVLGGLLGGVASAAFLGKRRKKIADPIDLVGSPMKQAEVKFDFGDEDDAISHLQAQSRAIRSR